MTPGGAPTPPTPPGAGPDPFTGGVANMPVAGVDRAACTSVGEHLGEIRRLLEALKRVLSVK
ncbi:MAG: hypothetical protein R3F14_09825 [Polyangiaceae bacterium]